MNDAMSTTKIIKGQIKQWEEPIGVMNAKFTAAHSEVRKSLNWEPATLYIGTGKLWTEDEVRTLLRDIQIAMVRDMITTSEGRLVDNPPAMEIRDIAAKHGLPL